MGKDYWGPPTYVKGQRIYNINNLADIAELSGDTMQKTVTIQLKVRFKDKDRFNIVRRAAAQSARGLLAAAQLISDEHKPQIAVTAFDPFDGDEGIEIFEDTDTEE